MTKRIAFAGLTLVGALMLAAALGTAARSASDPPAARTPEHGTKEARW